MILQIFVMDRVSKSIILNKKISLADQVISICGVASIIEKENRTTG